MSRGAPSAFTSKRYATMKDASCKSRETGTSHGRTTSGAERLSRLQPERSRRMKTIVTRNRFFISGRVAPPFCFSQPHHNVGAPSFAELNLANRGPQQASFACWGGGAKGGYSCCYGHYSLSRFCIESIAVLTCSPKFSHR